MSDPAFVSSRVDSILGPHGFECHSFKVGWYNDHVKSTFRLPYEENTLAVLAISTPSMFDKALKPFIFRNQCTGVKDPIDECISHQFQLVKEALPDINIDVLFDYELDHLRRPKILVQTAGHVAGAARYYQRKDLISDPWDDKKKIFGVSIHPKYGGWMAFRGVLIFKDVLVPALVRKDPPDPVPNNEDRIELLRRFNGDWKDWTFRDIIPAVEKYSEEQKLYFATLPKDRMQLIETMNKSHCANNS